MPTERAVPAADDLILPAALVPAVRGCIRRTCAVAPAMPSWFGHLVELGLSGLAVDAAQRDEQAHRRAAAHAAVSAALSRAGQGGKATPLAWRAVREAGSVRDPWSRAAHHAEAIVALTAAGAAERDEATLADAAGLTRRVGVDGERVRALAAVTRAAAAAGLPGLAADTAKRALAVADTAGFPSRRPDALATAVTALVAAGLDSEAREVAAQVDDPWARAEALVTVGADGDGEALTEALRAASAVSNLAWRAEAQAAVTTALCRLGDRDRARHTAAAIRDPVWRAEALLAVAASADRGTALSLTGEAARLARAVGYPWWRADGLAGVLAGLLAQDPGDLRPLAWAGHARVLIGVLRVLQPQVRASAVLGAIDPAQLTDWLACDLLAACARDRPRLAANLRTLAG